MYNQLNLEVMMKAFGNIYNDVFVQEKPFII